MSPPLSSPPVISGEGTPEREWADWRGWREAPRASRVDLLPAASRLVVVAPHPDDETLGAGGLIFDAVASGHEVLILAVTDGGASHPGSRRWPVPALVEQRARERAAALAVLTPVLTPSAGQSGPEVMRLGLPDGAVTQSVQALARLLGSQLRSTDVVIAPWRSDGHPDHESTAHAAELAVAEQGCALWQTPIWGWHWASPSGDELPVSDAVIYPLSAPAAAAKQRAAACFLSQREGDPSTGAPPVLPDWAVRRWLRDREVYLR